MVGGLTDASASVQPVLLRGVLVLKASLDLTPAVAPTPVGCSDASVTVLPVPLLTTFSSQSDLVKVTPVITPMLFSLDHRNFRCFRVGGPARPVSLNLSAGPASQSLFFLLPRETAAPAPASSPVRRTAAAAPLHRRPLAPPPPPELCSAAAHALLHRPHAASHAQHPHARAASFPQRRRSSPPPTKFPLAHSFS